MERMCSPTASTRNAAKPRHCFCYGDSGEHVCSNATYCRVLSVSLLTLLNLLHFNKQSTPHTSGPSFLFSGQLAIGLPVLLKKQDTILVVFGARRD